MLAGLYDEASSGLPRFLLLAGEAGIGKSALITEFARSASLRGSRVIEGSAPPITGMMTPFAAITALLRSLADADPAPQASSHAGTASGLTQLFQKPPEKPSSDGGAQLLLFERLLRLLQRSSEETTFPAVLVVEDLQWSDESSRQFISYLVSNARAFPLFGIFTHRIGDPAGLTTLAPLLDELARTAQAEYLELPPFSQDEVAIQVGLLTNGAATSEAIGQIAKLSGGNPSVVEELLQTRNPDASGSLRRLMLGRVAGLSNETQRFLRLAAVVGQVVPAALLDAAARLMKLDSGLCARIARDGRIIDVVDDQRMNVYAFRQPILQETLYADLLPADRAAMHGVIADVLRRDPDLHDDPLLRIEFARHAVRAGHLDAPAALVSAAEAAEQMYAFRSAHEFYEQAISARALTGPQRHRDIGFRLERPPPAQPTDRELRVRSGQAASLAGDPIAAIERLRGVIATDRVNDHRLISRLAQYCWEAGNHHDAVALFRKLVDDLDDAGLSASHQAEILQGGARTMLLAGDHQVAAEWADRAVAIAHASGQVSAERRARSTLSAALALLGDAPGSVLASEAVKTDEPASSSPSTVLPRPSRITDLLANYWTQSVVLDQAGRTSASADVAIEGWKRADRLGTGDSWGARLGALAGRRLIDLGRWASAAEIIDSMLDQATLGRPRSGEVLLLKARLNVRQGFLQEADACISRAQESMGDLSRPAEAMLLANVSAEQQIWRQQFTHATAIAEAALSEDSVSADRHTRMELVGIAVQAAADGAASARMRRSPGDRTASESTATELCGQLSGMVQAEPAPAARLRALVATAEAELMRARGSTDARSWKSVADMWTALEMPFQAIYANWRRAEILVTAATLSPTHATELQAVHQEAARLGTHIIMAHLESVARRARVDLARREPDSMQPATEAASQGPDHGLTARELEVLALVADGRSNRQIGESLSITENSAGRHVSNILSKLNARNRMEAASFAVGLNLIHGASPSDLLPPAQLGTGTHGRLALMFTDMARSTALIEAIGDDAWSDLANWHDAMLRAQFAAQQGQEVDHAGDGFFVAFVHVASAIRCAVAIQRALAEHRRSHGFAPTVKIGIHVDDVTRSGPRYQGKGVHAAARIGSAASPGEILVSSESLHGLVLPYAAGDTRLISARGLSVPVSVCSILW